MHSDHLSTEHTINTELLALSVHSDHLSTEHTINTSTAHVTHQSVSITY